MSITRNQIKKIEDKLIVKKEPPKTPYLAIKGEESWYIVNLKESLQNVRDGKKSRIIYPDSEEGKWLLDEKLVKFVNKPLVLKGYGKS